MASPGRRDASKPRGERGGRVPARILPAAGCESATCSEGKDLCLVAAVKSRLPAGTDVQPVTPMTSPAKQRVVTQQTSLGVIRPSLARRHGRENPAMLLSKIDIASLHVKQCRTLGESRPGPAAAFAQNAEAVTSLKIASRAAGNHFGGEIASTACPSRNAPAFTLMIRSAPVKPSRISTSAPACRPKEIGSRRTFPSPSTLMQYVCLS